MKVLVVNNMAPFVWGGAEELAANLRKNLIKEGHESEILRIPFQWEPATGIPEQMLLVRAMELFNVDNVICLKFPAYIIRHASKTLWLLHQYRQAYDLWDAGQTNLAAGEPGEALRNVIRNADNQAFSECRRIFTNSSVTQDRLLKYNGFSSEVLLPPLNDDELFIGGKAQGYIFAGGRVNGMKRQHLLVEAMRYLPNNIQLVVAGPPDTIEDAQRLELLVETLGLQDRVRLELRFLPRETLAEYMNGSLAVAYLPFDEDSLGYVAMEAATAGKALLTTTDAGGILGLVLHGDTGFVAEPTPRSLADSVHEFYKNPKRTFEMGLSARDRWRGLGINWPATIERLVT